MSVRAQTTKLSRQRDQRRALLKSLSESLIKHEELLTTKAKAKALRPYVEKLVTRSKNDTLTNRRLIKRRLDTEEAVDKLFTDIAPRFKDRPGGYTRTNPAGWRRGDNAEMARISFLPADKPATETAAEEKPATSEQTTKEEAKK